MDEIKVNHSYIVKGNKALNFDFIRKIFVVEVTKTTVYYQNMDAESKNKTRQLISDFVYDWKIVEDLGNNNTRTKLDLMFGKPTI